MGNANRRLFDVVLLLAAVIMLSGCPLGFDKVRADFVGAPRIGYAALTVTFQADVQAIAPYVLGNKFRDGSRPTITVLDYFWTFGDGAVGKGKTTIHIYRAPGKYDVGLTVFIREDSVDGNGNKASQTSVVNVYKPKYITVLSPNLPPVANAGPNRVATLGQAVMLDGTESYDPEGEPLTYAWTAAVQEGGGGDEAPFTLEGADSATPSFTTSTHGVYVLTLIVNDGELDSAPDTALVRTDQEPPTINYGAGGTNAETIHVECGSESFETPTATDEQEGDLTANLVVQGTVDLSTPGTYVLVYTVSDSSGNAAEPFTLTVIVEDTLPPVITLLGNAQMSVECPAPFTDPGATALDACEGEVPVQASGLVNTATPGVYTITYDAADSAGNQAAQVIRTVNVVDATPPVITLNGAAQMTIECGTPFVDPGATALDTCEGDVPVQAAGTVDTATPGNYIVTYDATDNSGNQAAQVTRVVTVVDTTPPVITLDGAAQMTIECGTPFVDPGATALDTCEGDVPVQAAGTVDTATPGNYIVTYDATDNSGNQAAQVTRVVTVVDTTPPVITLDGAAQMTVECGTPFVDPGATALDACEGDVPVRVSEGGNEEKVNTGTPGNYVIFYDAADSAGNQATQVARTVTVVDTTPPVITLNGTAQFVVECGEPFTDPGATALDICEGDVPVQIGGTVDTSTTGNYTITYDAADSAGNQAAQVTRTVTVVDTTPPVITLNGAAQITVECGSLFIDPGATARDACQGNVPVQAAGTVDTATPGNYVITYNATDNAGNQAVQVARTVTVVDTTPPVITLNGAAQMTVECGTPFVDPGATALDACQGNVPVQTAGTVDTGTPGNYVITYNATDNAGNQAVQ
ncbi:MAG TPA: DUF5011 domain-containing protein, partial [Candidatus Hydrogenedentes bacterium]|nr:DUF5011 domain-containing protein [Candidatus Hydrogenedentota bacterium]